MLQPELRRPPVVRPSCAGAEGIYSRVAGLDDVNGVASGKAKKFMVTTIATLNQRDFGVVRPLHSDAFELIP